MADNTNLNNIEELPEAINASGGNLKFGLNNINALKFGTNTVQKIMYGSAEVWSATTGAYSITYNLSHCYGSDLPTEISKDDELDFYISAYIGYQLVSESVSVTGCDYSISEEDEFYITLFNPTDNVTVSVSAEPLPVYNITYNLSHCSGKDLPTTITPDADIYINLRADSGYKITEDCISISGCDFEYDEGSGLINLYNARANVTVTVTAEQSASYTITYNLTDCEVEDDPPTIISTGEEVEVEIWCDGDYRVTEDCVTVTGCSFELTDYGNSIILSNPYANVTVTIVAEQIPEYNITYNLTNCSGDYLPETILDGDVEYPMLATSPGYIITEDCIQVTNGDLTGLEYYEEEELYEFGIENPTGDVTVTVTAITE